MSFFYFFFFFFFFLFFFFFFFCRFPGVISRSQIVDKNNNAGSEESGISSAMDNAAAMDAAEILMNNTNANARSSSAGAAAAGKGRSLSKDKLLDKVNHQTAQQSQQQQQQASEVQFQPRGINRLNCKLLTQTNTLILN